MNAPSTIHIAQTRPDPAMYSLATGLFKRLTQKDEYYILILGLDNAGKSTLLEKIKSVYTGHAVAPDRIVPTVGMNMGKIDVNRSRLNFWDVGGQKELHAIWEKYYAEAHAVVFVVDATDAARIDECKCTFERVVTNDGIEGVPVLMLANKQDVPGAMKVHEIKEIFNHIAVKLGARDSKVLALSALRG
ncbi:hypothetical protein SeMB42_g07932, partial [Synchytrium endobioticum]